MQEFMAAGKRQQMSHDEFWMNVGIVFYLFDPRQLMDTMHVDTGCTYMCEVVSITKLFSMASV